MFNLMSDYIVTYMYILYMYVRTYCVVYNNYRVGCISDSVIDSKCFSPEVVR